jgi:hypothetical protein
VATIRPIVHPSGDNMSMESNGGMILARKTEELLIAQAFNPLLPY